MDPSSTDRIEKQIELKAAVARVWRALTDYKEFGAWFGVILEGPFVPGQAARGKITHPDYSHLTLELVVEKMEPERLFSYRWHPAAIDPNADYSKEPTTLVEFSLEKKGDGTLLRVTESGFDAIPAARRAEAFRLNDGGWAEAVRKIDGYVTRNP